MKKLRVTQNKNRMSVLIPIEVVRRRINKIYLKIHSSRKIGEKEVEERKLKENMK